MNAWPGTDAIYTCWHTLFLITPQQKLVLLSESNVKDVLDFINLL